jgi:general secretion pathway protein A
MLARPELEQLAQRVIARFHLEALSEAETLQYIQHRLAVAGHSGRLPLDRAACRRIHQLTRGVPRRINLLCDRALLGAYRWAATRWTGASWRPRPPRCSTRSRGLRAAGPGWPGPASAW